MGKAAMVSIEPVSAETIVDLKKINAACFPIFYSESYYKNVVQDSELGICNFVCWKGVRVGAITCRLEEHGSDSRRRRLYILTLGVLAPYRGKGIGTKLMESLLQHLALHQTTSFQGVTEILLHVQSSNDDAIHFYTSKFGFTKGELVRNYYRRLDPPDCFVLYKPLA